MKNDQKIDLQMVEAVVQLLSFVLLVQIHRLFFFNCVSVLLPEFDTSKLFEIKFLDIMATFLTSMLLDFERV